MIPFELTLITRPEPDATQTAIDLQDQAVPTLIEPIFKIDYKDIPNLGHVDTYIATSANALRALSYSPQDVRSSMLWVIGPHSRVIGRELGFKKVNQANGSVASLLETLLSFSPQQLGRIIYLRGQKVRQNLLEPLKARGFQCEEQIVYEAQPETEFSLQTLEAWPEIRHVLFYSPHTAQIFCELCQKHQLSTEHFTAHCLSEAIADEVRKYPSWKEIRLLDVLFPVVHDNLGGLA